MFNKNNFWYLNLVCLLIIMNTSGLTIPLRIALALNGIVLLIDFIRGLRSFRNGRNEEA